MSILFFPLNSSVLISARSNIQLSLMKLWPFLSLTLSLFNKPWGKKANQLLFAPRYYKASNNLIHKNETLYFDTSPYSVASKPFSVIFPFPLDCLFSHFPSTPPELSLSHRFSIIARERGREREDKCQPL